MPSNILTLLQLCLTHFLVISRMLCRVTPGNMMPSRGGVASSSTGKEHTEDNTLEIGGNIQTNKQTKTDRCCNNHNSPLDVRLVTLSTVSISDMKFPQKIKPDSLTSILIDPVKENVHGSCLGDLVVVSVQPEYLLTSEILRFILGSQRTTIVPAPKASVK